MSKRKPQVVTIIVLGTVWVMASVTAANAATVSFKMTANQTTLLVGQTTDVTVSLVAEPSRPAGQGVASWQFDLDIVPQPAASPLQVLGAVTFLADFAGYLGQPFTNSEVDGEIRAFGAATTSFNAGTNGQYTDVARFTLQALQIGTASYQLGSEGVFEAYVMGPGGPEEATPAWPQGTFVIDVVPEPVSILGLMALCGMALIRRRW